MKHDKLIKESLLSRLITAQEQYYVHVDAETYNARRLSSP